MNNLLDEKILETESFVVGQDMEVPILGFFIIASKDKNKNKISDFADSELSELILLQKKVRVLMENLLGIKVVYFFQNEDTEHGFHIWCFPRHLWMEELGNKIQSVRPIMNFAKENMFTEENLEIIKKSCEEIRKYLEKNNMKIENLKFIDCHSHPHDKKFLEMGVDVDKMMRDLLEDGGATIAIGTDYTEMENAINFAKKYENCWVTIGIHPADNHAEIYDERKFEEFLELGDGKVVGIGECGLDYFYFDKILKEKPDFNKVTEQARQKELFVRQIEFALKHDLPLVIHGRPTKNSMDAYRDILDILEKYRGLRGHAHFFVGNVEIAERFLKLGFLMSFDGPITFTDEYDNVIKFLPMENIMIETDSPYAAPGAYRGQLNYPKYVVEVAKKIAELKNISLEEVLDITKNNAIKLFNLKN